MNNAIKALLLLVLLSGCGPEAPSVAKNVGPQGPQVVRQNICSFQGTDGLARPWKINYSLTEFDDGEIVVECSAEYGVVQGPYCGFQSYVDPRQMSYGIYMLLGLGGPSPYYAWVPTTRTLTGSTPGCNETFYN